MALSVPVCAQETSTAPAEAEPTPAVGARSDVFRLGVVQVYGTKLSPAEALPQAVDADTIQMFERREVGQALDLLPGVTQNNAGTRNESGVYVRGFDLREVPVFIDGIPVYVPYDGYVDLGRFTTYDVSRISVSKGFSSVLYGPNTMGGAINIVSRRPEKPIEIDAQSGWFNGNGREGAANLGTKQSGWYMQLGGAYLAQDSFQLSDGFKAKPTQGIGDRNNSDREDWNVSVKAALTPNATDEYALGYFYHDGEKGVPPYAGSDPLQSARFWRWPVWNDWGAYYVSQTNLGDKVYVKPRFYFVKFDNTLDAFDDATYTTQKKKSSFTSIYDDYTWGASLEAGTELIPHNHLSGAFHFELDHHKEHNVGAPYYSDEDQTFSVALEDAWSVTKQLSIVPGVSYDIRDPVKAVDTSTGKPINGETLDSVNGQVGAFYDTGQWGVVHATFAHKSRFPTIKDRYSYRLGQAISNPDLKPEDAMHYEIGYAGNPVQDLWLNAALFFIRIEDTIQSVNNVATSSTGTALSQMRNVGKAENKGGELSAEYSWRGQITFGGSYSYLDRDFLSTTLRPTDTPRHKLFGFAELVPTPQFSLIPSFEYESSRNSTTYGVEAGAFAVVDLKGVVRLPYGVTVNGGVTNLLDRNYALAEGFPAPGRMFFANATYRF
jgi:iron complex outermembrane receptor protein